MANINKVIYGGRTLIDLSGDTISPDKLLVGFKAHMPDGSIQNGTCNFDMSTAECTAAAAEILLGKTAGVKGQVVTGTMPNNGAVTGTIAGKTKQYTISRGYHDGSGKVSIASAEQAKLIPENIRQGVTILEVEGTMSTTEGANPQAKEVTPTIAEQQVLPDSDQGYNYLSQVTVKPIPYSETENTAGGLTATIA